MSHVFSYTCNPKYICEELMSRNLDLDLVWITDNDNNKLKYYPAKGIRCVKLGTFACYKEVFSAKIWINNGVAFSNYFDKKPDQLYIQTMHGSLGIKRLDNAILSRSRNGLIGRLVIKREESNTDFVITNSLFEENVFKGTFWYKTPMLRLGHARTDILFMQDKDHVQVIKEKICNQYHIPTDRRLVMYGPTFRGQLSNDQLDIDYEALIQALELRFGQKFAVLFRYHPRSKLIFPEKNGESIVFDVTHYPDIQELMLISDIAITDYSSWIFDFVVTKRPGFIYATDLSHYNNTTGFYYELEETPFPIARSNEELLHNVLAFDETSYLEKVDDFLADMLPVDDGHSSRRIADMLINKLSDK